MDHQHAIIGTLFPHQVLWTHVFAPSVTAVPQALLLILGNLSFLMLTSVLSSASIATRHRIDLFAFSIPWRETLG